MGGCVRGRRTTPVANSVIMPTNKPNMTHRPLLISLDLVHPRPLCVGARQRQHAHRKSWCAAQQLVWPHNAPGVVDELVGRLHLEELGQLLGLLALELQGHGAAATGRATPASGEQRHRGAHKQRRGCSQWSRHPRTLRCSSAAARSLPPAGAAGGAVGGVNRGAKASVWCLALHPPGSCSPLPCDEQRQGVPAPYDVRHSPRVWGRLGRLQVWVAVLEAARDWPRPVAARRTSGPRPTLERPSVQRCDAAGCGTRRAPGGSGGEAVLVRGRLAKKGKSTRARGS